MGADRFERPPARTLRHTSDVGRWEATAGRPHPALRPYVRDYLGWFEHMAAPLCRREPPSECIPVIISFGAPIRVFEAGESAQWTDLGSFSTGAYDTFVRVVSDGPSGGLQVNFTILGARLFLGRPLGELTNRALPLDELIGPSARAFEGELRDAPTWNARFERLDREFLSRLDAAPPPSAAVLCAWDRLLRSGGRLPIGAIVDEVGWSQRHLIARFREELGLAPKVLARVLRFSRAMDAVRGGRGALADIACDCGYYDQAHFSRDFREFAGVTPTELRASLLPDGAGIAG